jgi:N-acetylglutamate synthase-like GNAT family acetyltransferase
VSITYRLATHEDIPALTQLIPISVRALLAGHYTPQQVEGALRHGIFGVDSQLISDGTYYVAESGGRIVGCGGWSKRKTLYGTDHLKEGIAAPLLSPATDAARIRCFFIDPGWARRGIGRRIMELCEAAARQEGFHKATLGATHIGEFLYASMGYAVSERFEIPLADGEVLPAAQMVKSLA